VLGWQLPPLLPALHSAGLRAVTIHLDTLRDDRVEVLMGSGASVAHAIGAAAQSKKHVLQVKLNMVVQRGRNDDELIPMLDQGRSLGVEVRFIEQMNTGSAAGYVKETFIAGADIVSLVAARRGARCLPRRHHSDPAALFATDDGVVFGVIASDTEPFCAHCDRLRLSADGRVRGCLYQAGGLPLGTALRAGADDEGLLGLLDSALDEKQSHHPLLPRARTPFSMADVGG
jgi:cyclic pyranopterin phosphate synthase